MDPDTCLGKIRILLASIQEINSNEEANETLLELAELMSSLDTWMSQGGFLPLVWSQHSKTGASSANLSRPDDSS